MKFNDEFKMRRFSFLITGAILNLQLCSFTAFAADAPAPAQTPLVIAQSGVAPNIMLLFDDSSSMASMHPSDSGYQILLTYHPDDIGSTYSGYRNRVYYASSNTNDLVAAGTRSCQLNSLYYNPAVTYKPWANPDGTLMPNLNPAAVPMYITAPNDYPKMDFTFSRRDFYFTAGTAADITAGLAPYHRILYQYPSGGSSSFSYRGNYTVQSPAMYFIYHGPDANNPNLQVNLNSNANLRNINNYTPVVITEIGSGGITQPASRTDCAVRNNDGSVQCSRAEELQNFVNWFGYYRGRTRTAIAALTHVFARDFGMQYRLGWGAFNQGGATIAGRYYNYLRQGVKAYEGDHAEAFYAWLRNFERNTPGNTPTRAVLDATGQYYSNADNRGPWGAKPGENDTTPHLACRRSYSIVMTDGGWNAADASTNLAGYTRQTGGLISGQGGQSYVYMPKAPYEGASTRNSTYLSDVALYYWNRDLRPDLPNIVVPTNQDEAFWQHMVTHTIGYGTTGSLKETDWPALLVGTKGWGTDKFDDLWHAAVTGHGTYSSASDIENLVASLSSIMQNMALQQVAAPHRVSSSQYLETSNRTYIPSYQTALWAGELISYTMGSSGGLGSVEWRATDRLT